MLMLVVPGEAFSIYLMWGTGTRCLDCWYINLQEPIRRTSIGFEGKLVLPGNVTVGAPCLGVQKGSCQVQVQVAGN